MKSKLVRLLPLLCVALGLVLLSGCVSGTGGGSGGHHHSSIKTSVSRTAG